MARPRKQPKPEAKPPADVRGHNTNGGMTDAQRQTLFFQHLRKYKTELEKKKAQDAAFRNACKLARAELGDAAIEEIKDAILLKEPAGEAALQARIERQIRIARYLNLPLGAQTDLFADSVADRRPATEVAFEAGKVAGMQGETCRPPHDPSVPQHDSWIEGWHLGQASIFDIQRKEDGKLFEGPLPDPS